MKKFNIIGGGIGGLCAAIALHRKGFQVQVYESASEIKALGAGLTLSVNAIKALRTLGLDKDILEAGNIFGDLKILTETGKVVTSTNVLELAKKYGAGNVAVHRADLQKMLVSHLPEEVLQLNKKCVDVQEKKEEVTAFFEDGTHAVSDGLLAFDGIHSAVRQKLLPQVQLRYAGYTCWRAVIHYAPENFNTKLCTETWGRKGRFGIVPLTDQQVYWFATHNAPQNDERMRYFRVKDLYKLFKSYHHPVAEVLKNTDDTQLIWNDILDFPPIAHYAFGRILLAGDAAHATTPNMGQGACMAMEDAVVAAHCLEVHQDIKTAFREFEQGRKKRTHRIVKTSYQIGRVAQWENPVLCAMRNTLFRLLPEKVSEKQIRYLYEVEF